MIRGTRLVLLVLAGGATLGTAAPVLAGHPGIRIYTWTDARGVTHYSDTPRRQGTSRKLTLPTPPPPDETAIAANKAWQRKLDREVRAELAQQSARRRAEREAATEQRQPAPEPETVVRYEPTYFPARRYRRYRRRHLHRGHHAKLPSAAFPHDALPSSFPNPMASSFPPGLPSSFPEKHTSPPHGG